MATTSSPTASTPLFCHNLLMEEWPVFDVQKVLWDMFLLHSSTALATPSSGSSSSDQEKKSTQEEPVSVSAPDSTPLPEYQLVPSESDKKPLPKTKLVPVAPDSIVSIRPIGVSARATRKRLQSKKVEQDALFQPKPSKLARRAFQRSLTSDDDIWVERFYFNRSKQRVYFYRSYKTGKCVLSEPPSGAHCIVYLSDLDMAPANIQQFATERLDREVYLHGMERSRPTLPPPGILPRPISPFQLKSVKRPTPATVTKPAIKAGTVLQ